MEITIIGGVPCTGKTTLMRKIKTELLINKKLDDQDMNILKGYQDKKKENVIFGLYEGDLFDGTDKLSMAVQPQAIDWLHKADTKIKNVFIEGDRLFKPSFIKACKNITSRVRIIVLEAGQETLDYRHATRKDEQSKEWLIAKKTTVDNIKKEFPCHIFSNQNLNDQDIILNYILSNEYYKCVNPAQRTLF